MSRDHRAMRRNAHAELVAARDTRAAVDTWPRLASVRSLYVLQQERKAKRERVARLIFCGLFPALALLAFIMMTGGF